MNRVIKFRGLRFDTKQWAYGDLKIFEGVEIGVAFTAFDKESGHYNDYKYCEVKPDSVGQFTGLLDKNGKEVFDGDIVEVPEYEEIGHKLIVTGFIKYEIKWYEDIYNFVAVGNGEWLSLEDIEGCLIIGDIHQNPELLK